MNRSNSTTERLFRSAGIANGMRVLELGCGPGEITEVIAGIVGPGGSLLAVDHDERMLAAAGERIRGAANVSFAKSDLNTKPDYLAELEHESFDAIAGRRVLMYLSEPSVAIARLLPWLRSGGLVVFEEADSTMGPGQTQSMPAHEEAVSWLNKMLAQEGVDRSMGFHLPDTYINAGLEVKRVWAEAVVEGQGDQYPLSELLTLLSPRLQAAGIATSPEVEDLVARIITEVDPASIFLSAMRFCAVGRKTVNAEEGRG